MSEADRATETTADTKEREHDASSCSCCSEAWDHGGGIRVGHGMGRGTPVRALRSRVMTRLGMAGQNLLSEQARDPSAEIN